MSLMLLSIKMITFFCVCAPDQVETPPFWIRPQFILRYNLVWSIAEFEYFAGRKEKKRESEKNIVAANVLSMLNVCWQIYVPKLSQ